MSPDFYDYFAFGSVDASNTALGIFLAVYLVIWLFAMAYSIMVYIFHSLGLYTIANRRGIHHPWLAWIPVGDVWILGSIADQYRYVAKGQVKNRRKTLVGLIVAMFVMLFVMMGGVIALVITGVGSELNEAFSDSSMIVPLLILIVSYAAIMVIAVVATVYQYISYYDLFYSCNPDHAVAFLVLSIFFNFLLPFFVFACRKKDLGMPPRRVQAPAAPWQPAPAPAQPVWQNAVTPQPPAAGEAPAVQEEVPAEEPTVDEDPAEE